MFPKFFLGGFDISETDEYESMFAEFWRNYATCHPSHPVYEKSEEDQKRCIPIALHGDEGRSLAKVPLLVISYQVLIPYTGPNDLSLAQYPRCKMIPSCIHVPVINEEFQGWWVGQVRHSFTTRLLYSLIPSTWYAKNDASVDGLLKDLSTDMTDIFQHGITIQVFWHQFNS